MACGATGRHAGGGEVTSATDREANVRFGYGCGWSFTPLNGKTPILRGWQKAPRETLEQALAWAAAGNVGLRTGAASGGLVIVDVDPGGDAAPLNLPPTVRVRTDRGGAHYYFRCAQPVGNSNSTKLGPYIDSKGNGGQVVYPGSVHPDTGEVYRWAEGCEPWSVTIAELPEHILDRLTARPKPPKAAAPPAPSQHLGNGSAYALAALRGECEAVANTAPGGRNDRLNMAALKLGQLVAAGHLDRAEVEAELRRAAEVAGLEPQKIIKTIASGLSAGMAEPRVIPPEAGAQHIAIVTSADMAAGATLGPCAFNCTDSDNAELLTVAEGNGRFIITACLNGESLTDRVIVTSAKSRAAFAAQVCRRWPQAAKQDIEGALEQLAREHVEARARRPDTSADGERDPSMILRPERFITSAVSGFAVPVLGEHNGKPVGRWTLLLQWDDGKRQKRELNGKLTLPGGRPLWIAPTPAEPGPTQAKSLAGWSLEARRAWLDGAPAPNQADVFKRLCTHVSTFIDLPQETAAGTTATLALWTLLTYGYPAFDAVPYLHVGGALASGKSRLFEILVRLVFRPLTSSSLTGPALFRTLHDRGGTLLLDEAERLRQPTPETAEIMSMLLAGYKRGGQATRLEPVNDTFRSVSFDVYGPKSLAGVAGLPAALASRCISIRMFRAAPDSPKPRRRIDADPDTWRQLRDDLYALALSNGPAWLTMTSRADVCPSMSGRNSELWQPLLALAAWIEEAGATGLLTLMQKHALANIEGAQEDQTPDVDEALLKLLAEDSRAGNTPTPGEILTKAQTAEPQTFRNWSARGVAEHLERYGLTTHKTGGRKVIGQEGIDRLRRVQACYGIDLGFSGGIPPRTYPNIP